MHDPHEKSNYETTKITLADIDMKDAIRLNCNSCQMNYHEMGRDHVGLGSTGF